LQRNLWQQRSSHNNRVASSSSHCRSLQGRLCSSHVPTRRKQLHHSLQLLSMGPLQWLPKSTRL
jgi:hypothetical protein